jgi:hypothetical protein
MSRRAVFGPNAVLEHGARPWSVLARQLRSPQLLLLATAAVASFFPGQRTEAVIIALIVGASVGLGFVNEYRAVLMGTSSNFGNIFSAAATSAVLTFLPMLPSQIPGEFRSFGAVPADSSRD